MSVKDEILRIFESSRDRRVSGAELAAALGVSRNAVWKAVNALRAEGYAIDAAPRRGYRLSGQTDILSAQGIARFLPPELPLRLDVRREVDSTNLIAKRLGAQGEPEGLVVVAEAQSAGRGRLGRSFLSPAGTGTYMSLLVRPRLTAADSLWLTTAAAVAVAEAIEAVSGREARIKWVNDVYVNDRKVCGILTEAALDLESGALEYAVVGIGINVRPPAGGFPPELRDIAGAVLPAGNADADARSRLTAEVLRRFWAYYRALPAHPFHAEYCRRSWVVGREITVIQGAASRPARAVGIDAECRLLVEYPDGSRDALASGEVSVRPAAPEKHAAK